MLNIDKHIFPASLDEAYEILQATPDSVILGGCGYLRLADRKIGKAIDLTGLGLDTIADDGETLRIGAMVTLRSLETDPLAAIPFHAVLPRAVRDIVGIQLRSCVTVGGTVAGRYPFSDPICAFLALDAEVELHKSGRLPLAAFLEEKPARDILTAVVLPKCNGNRLAAFDAIRKTRTDYAVLNVAVSKAGDEYRVAVGSRPGRAVLVPEAAEFLHTNGLNEDSAAEAGRICAEVLQFGDNPRGSARYRREICSVLIKRALQEVRHAG